MIETQVQWQRVTAWLLVIVAVVFAAAFLLLGGRDGLLVEDGPLETTTAALFAVAAVIGWVRARSTGDRIWWVLPGFAVVAFLDEISWGMRIVDVGAPVIAGVEVDSLHDAVDIADHLLAEAGIGRTMAAGLAGALGVAGIVGLALVGRLGVVVDWVRRHPVVPILGTSVALLGAAVVIDQIAATDVSRFAEEMLEYGAAAVLLVGAWSIPVRELERVPA